MGAATPTVMVRKDARYGAAYTANDYVDRSRFRRRAQRHRRGETRRARPWHRIRCGASRVLQTGRGKRTGQRQSDFRARRCFRSRLFQSDSGGVVSHAGDEYSAAAEASRSQSRARASSPTPLPSATGIADQFYDCHGQLRAFCTARLWIVPARVDGSMEAAARRTRAQANLSDVFRDVKAARASRHRSRADSAANKSLFNSGEHPIHRRELIGQMSIGSGIARHVRVDWTSKVSTPMPGSAELQNSTSRQNKKGKRGLTPALSIFRASEFRYLILSKRLALPSSISSLSASEISSCSTFFAASQSPRS